MAVKKHATAICVASALSALGMIGSAAAAPLAPPPGSVAAPALAAPAQYFSFSYGYGRPYYGRRYGYRRPYYGPRYYAPPPPVTYYSGRPYVVERRATRRWHGDDVARCASRFRSFNVRTGTYITYGGEERLCPYLR